MCVMKTPKMPEMKRTVAATDTREAIVQSDLETRLRKRRAGAAADVLTGPAGIPATAQMGGVAQ